MNHIHGVTANFQPQATCERLGAANAFVFLAILEHGAVFLTRAFPDQDPTLGPSLTQMIHKMQLGHRDKERSSMYVNSVLLRKFLQHVIQRHDVQLDVSRMIP